MSCHITRETSPEIAAQQPLHAPDRVGANTRERRGRHVCRHPNDVAVVIDGDTKHHVMNGNAGKELPSRRRKRVWFDVFKHRLKIQQPIVAAIGLQLDTSLVNQVTPRWCWC